MIMTRVAERKHPTRSVDFKAMEEESGKTKAI